MLLGWAPASVRSGARSAVQAPAAPTSPAYSPLSPAPWAPAPQGAAGPAHPPTPTPHRPQLQPSPGMPLPVAARALPRHPTTLCSRGQRLGGNGARATPPRRRLAVRVEAVAEFIRSTPREAILCQRFTAHGAALAAALVLEDSGARGGRGGSGVARWAHPPGRPPLPCARASSPMRLSRGAGGCHAGPQARGGGGGGGSASLRSRAYPPACPGGAAAGSTLLALPPPPSCTRR